jgi:hypothetical protein
VAPIEKGGWHQLEKNHPLVVYDLQLPNNIPLPQKPPHQVVSPKGGWHQLKKVGGTNWKKPPEGAG